MLLTDSQLKNEAGFQEINELFDHRGEPIQNNILTKSLSAGRQCVISVSKEHLNDGHEVYDDDSGHDDHWNGHELEC